MYHGLWYTFTLHVLPVQCRAADVEIFIAGESYAGFYVPWIAEHIVKMQLVTAGDGSTSRIKAGK
jgi:carboxypeptidase C (cathepsin A)